MPADAQPANQLRSCNYCGKENSETSISCTDCGCSLVDSPVSVNIMTLQQRTILRNTVFTMLWFVAGAIVCYFSKHFYMLTYLLVSFFMYQSMKQPPLVTWSLKVRHFIVTVIVAMMTSENAYGVFFIVLHPQLALANFYVSKGFAPAWLVFSLEIASTVLGAFIWSNSSSIAARKPKARALFLQVWPFFVTISLVQYIAVVQVREVILNSWIYLFAYYIFGIAMIGGLGLLIQWHFRSRKLDDLFFPA